MNAANGIALVSETLRYVLIRAARSAVGNTSVNIQPPQPPSPGGGPIINLFLYGVTQTADGRNQDLPTRIDGEVIAQPTLTLELDYLISFTGPVNSVDAERLLGTTMVALHAEPWLTSDIVTSALDALGPTDLQVTDLDLPAEIYPLNLNIEQRSKLWSVFLQVPYRLSLEYRVRAVIVPADLPLLLTHPVEEVVVTQKPMT